MADHCFRQKWQLEKMSHHFRCLHDRDLVRS